MAHRPFAAIVVYDGRCGICRATRRIVGALDWLGSLRWVRSQDQEARGMGLTEAEMDDSVWLVRGANRWCRTAAMQRILLRLPILYAVAGFTLWISWAFALSWVVLFSPLARPAGDAIYRWVARNRYRLPGSTCPPGDE